MLDVRLDLGDVLLELLLTQCILLHHHPLPLYGQRFVDDQARFVVDARRQVNGIASVGLGHGMGKCGAGRGRIGTVIPRIVSSSSYVSRKGDKVSLIAIDVEVARSAGYPGSGCPRRGARPRKPGDRRKVIIARRRRGANRNGTADLGGALPNQGIDVSFEVVRRVEIVRVVMGDPGKAFLR